MSVLITTHFKPVENIRGFSRETVIEITCNIESQEYRRCEIIDILAIQSILGLVGLMTWKHSLELCIEI